MNVCILHIHPFTWISSAFLLCALLLFFTMYRIYIFYHSYAKQYPMCALCVIYRMIFFCSRHICWQQAHWQHPIPATFNRHIKLRRTAKNIAIRRHRYRCSCNHTIFYSIWWYGAIWFVFYLQKPKNWLIPPADPIKMGEKKLTHFFGLPSIFGPPRRQRRMELLSQNLISSLCAPKLNSRELFTQFHSNRTF